MTSYIELITFVKQNSPKYIDVSKKEEYNLEISEDDWYKLYKDLLISGYVFNTQELGEYKTNELVASHKDKIIFIPPNNYTIFKINGTK